LAGETFVDTGRVPHGNQAAETIYRAEASVALVIPPGFGRSVAEGRPTDVQVLVDGADSIQGTLAQSAVSAYAAQRSIALMTERLTLQAALSATPVQFSPIRVEPRNLYNQSLDSYLHFVPGIAAVLLLVVTVIVTALGLSREDEAGTLEQVLVTPLTPTTLVLGKTLPYALIGLVDLALVIAAGAAVFNVPVRGHLSILFVAGLLYMLTTLGLGLLAGTVAKSQQQAFFNVVFFLLPAMVLSGFIAPIEAMPEWLQPVSAFNPVRHFVEILRSVLLKGATMNDLAHSYAALAGMGLCVFPFAAWALRRKLR
jgi:ABC-2 type transport system permease protein